MNEGHVDDIMVRNRNNPYLYGYEALGIGKDPRPHEPQQPYYLPLYEKGKVKP